MQNFFEIHGELRGILPFLLFSIGEGREQTPVSRPHGYEAHQFLWVSEGTGHFCVDGVSFDLHAGEGIFFRKNIGNAYEGQHFYTKWISFFIDEKTLDHLGVGNLLRFDVPPYLNAEFQRLHQAVLSGGTVWTRSALGYSFVNELFSNILTAKDRVEDKVIRMLESRFSEPLTLDDIANEVGMDRFSLCRYFSKHVGTTVMDELLRIRIEKAKHYLRFGNDPVRQVGLMCGFESAGYFGKRFRETVGCTPLEYRKRHSESALLYN